MLDRTAGKVSMLVSSGRHPDQPTVRQTVTTLCCAVVDVESGLYMGFMGMGHDSTGHWLDVESGLSF